MSSGNSGNLWRIKTRTEYVQNLNSDFNKNYRFVRRIRFFANSTERIYIYILRIYIYVGEFFFWLKFPPKEGNAFFNKQTWNFNSL